MWPGTGHTASTDQRVRDRDWNENDVVLNQDAQLLTLLCLRCHAYCWSHLDWAASVFRETYKPYFQAWTANTAPLSLSSCVKIRIECFNRIIFSHSFFNYVSLKCFILPKQIFIMKCWSGCRTVHYLKKYTLMQYSIGSLTRCKRAAQNISMCQIPISQRLLELHCWHLCMSI